VIALLVFLRLLVPASDAEALRRTAPQYLDHELAAEHLAAARVAGAVFSVDPDLLLAIAWRESRYVASAVTAETGGRVSCGVMTPEPTTNCVQQTVLDGYLAGARHLRVWLDATHSERAALLGYAGGYRLIEACRRGPVLRVRGKLALDLCRTRELDRAAWIRRERARSPEAS
jgi:hypothetical protein